MASKCTITFDNNPFGVYYAGQVVSGTAELITTRPKTIRSIYITVSGFSETRWTENIVKQDTHGKPEKALETYSASEMYYSSEKYVYGQSGGSQLELPAGKYVFPFQATVPPNAPTSFNGSFGQIQHEVTVVVDRVMRYNNVFKQGYTVISPYDLNLNPEHAKPLQKIEEKTFCWSLFCAGNGPMVMHVRVSFGAYAPGQKIRFNIVLDNQSDVQCNDVKVRLIKKVNYTSRSPEEKKQVTEIKIADNHCGEVIKHNKAEFNEYLQIPPTTPSSLESCGIIKVSYSLRFIAKVFRLHGDMVIDFPFTIGTVPIYASANDQGPGSQQNIGTAPNYKPLAPPSFEEDLRAEQFESNTFKPRYPVFLNDPNLTNGDNTEPTSNNLYPSTKVTPARELTPNPVPIPTRNPTTPTPASYPTGPSPATAPYPTTGPTPTPATVKQPPYPTSPAAPSKAAKAPYPTSPTPTPAPAKTPYPTTPSHSMSNAKPNDVGGGSSIEVLGFSVPPDYKPTPSAPSANENQNIGWK